MSKSNSPAPERKPVDLPTFHQMVAFVLMMAEKNLARLVEIRNNDEHWDDLDVDTDMTTELVMSHIQAMKAKHFKDYGEFSLGWFWCSSALNLANQSFSRPDCWYGRVLEALCKQFAAVPEMVEQV